MMRKILIATDVFAPTPGGEPVAIDQLVRGLAGRGHEVHVIAPANSLRSHMEDIVEFHLHRIGSLPINRKRKLRFAYDIGRYFMKRVVGLYRNFDAVSAPSPYAAKAFEQFGIKSVISISNGVDLSWF